MFKQLYRVAILALIIGAATPAGGAGNQSAAGATLVSAPTIALFAGKVMDRY